jgi:hypothetical protein
MALFGVPMMRQFAKEEANAVARPTFIGSACGAIAAMGTVTGPRADTVAPSLMKFVVTPVKKLEAT